MSSEFKKLDSNTNNDVSDKRSDSIFTGGVLSDSFGAGVSITNSNRSFTSSNEDDSEYIDDTSNSLSASE